MNSKHLIVASIFCFLCLFACAPGKGTSAPYEKVNVIVKTVAWNEDLDSRCILVLTQSGKFVYTIARKNDQINDTLRYFGKYKYQGDTLWMKYHRRNSPWQFKDYLITEITGNYLIQSFRNDSARIYLRVLGNLR